MDPLHIRFEFSTNNQVSYLGFATGSACHVWCHGWTTCLLGCDSIKRCHLTSIGLPIVEIRRSYDCLISTMGFPILVRWHLYIESGPCMVFVFDIYARVLHHDCTVLITTNLTVKLRHYGDVIMGAIASQMTSHTIVYSTVYSDADQRKYQSSTSLAFVCGIHQGPMNSPHKWPVTRKIFPFDDVIMTKASPNR